MHPDECALLAAVCAAPDDDLPRLVYADWLDEQGQHVRADFIRSQIELAQLEEWFRRFTTRDERKANGPEFGRRLSFLRKRVKGLLEHAHAEATGVPDRFPFRWGMGIERGFLASVWVQMVQVDLLPDYLTARGGALPEVAVAGVGSWLVDGSDVFTGEAGWAFVTFLCLVDRHEHESPWPGPTPAQLGRLADAPLARLRHLDLGNGHLTDAHATVLAERFDLPALRVLELRGNRLTPAGVSSLSEARWWAGLHELRLSCSPPVWDLVEVLTTARIPNLQALTLGDNHQLSGRLGERMAAVLAAAYPAATIHIT